MSEYIRCPHCGKTFKDYAVAKILRDSVGFIEELGRDIGPILGSYLGRSTGLFGGGYIGKKIMKKAVGNHGDPLLSKTIYCPYCKGKFQSK